MKNNIYILMSLFWLCVAFPGRTQAQSPESPFAGVIAEARAKTDKIVISCLPWEVDTNHALSPERLKERPLIRVEFNDTYALIKKRKLLDALQQSFPRVSSRQSDIRCRVDMYDQNGVLLITACVDRFGTSGYVQDKPVEMGKQFKDVLAEMLASIEQ